MEQLQFDFSIPTESVSGGRSSDCTICQLFGPRDLNEVELVEVHLLYGALVAVFYEGDDEGALRCPVGGGNHGTA